MINILDRTVGQLNGVMEGINVKDNVFPNTSVTNDKFAEALSIIAELVCDLDDILSGENAPYRLESAASAVRNGREFFAAHHEFLK